MERFDNYQYLESLTEAWLFTNYLSAIKHDSPRPFSSEFTLENRDSLYRFKFKALNATHSDEVSIIDKKVT